MTQTHSQKIGLIVRKAKARRRLAIITNASVEGKSLGDAAKLSGMKLAGIKTLLRREFSSQDWPIAEYSPMLEARKAQP